MTKQIFVGGGPVGGGAPVTIQSMTNTRTDDVAATVDQIRKLPVDGCHLAPSGALVILTDPNGGLVSCGKACKLCHGFGGGVAVIVQRRANFDLRGQGAF